MRRAKRPPSPDFPLGYGKEIYFWSFLVALLLFSVGGMFSLYEGLHKLGAPEPLSHPWIAVGVLVFAIIAESASMRAALQEVNKVRGSNSLRSEEHTSELQSLMRISYAVFCLKQKKTTNYSR